MEIVNRYAAVGSAAPAHHVTASQARALSPALSTMRRTSPGEVCTCLSSHGSEPDLCDAHIFTTVYALLNAECSGVVNRSRAGFETQGDR